MCGTHCLEASYDPQMGHRRPVKCKACRDCRRAEVNESGSLATRWMRPTPLVWTGLNRSIGIEVAALTPEDLGVLAAKSRLLLNTVGPYHLYGSPVVEACVTNGTHYLDVLVLGPCIWFPAAHNSRTGEAPWVLEMIKKHHETAKLNRAIVRNEMRAVYLRMKLSQIEWPDHPANRHRIRSIRLGYLDHGQTDQRKAFCGHQGSRRRFLC